MEGNTAIMTNEIILLLGLILFGGVIFSKLSDLVRLPDVVLFIVAGILLGPNVLNLINMEKYPVGNELILTLGAAYILYDGGREVNLKILNKVKFSLTMLSTVGVLVSTYILGYFAMKIFEIDFISALLLGVVISSTDPAVLVPLFKKVKIKDKLRQTIISESAFNDAVAAVTTFTIIGIIVSGSFSLNHSLIELVQSAGGGIVIGVLLGVLSTILISNTSYGILKEYPSKVALSTVCAAYAIATHVGGSGFMAVFIAGIIIGNKEILKLSHSDKHEITHFHFNEVLTVIFRMMIFVILGTQINFAVLSQNWKSALLVVIVLIFIARPISVLISISLDRRAEWSLKEVIYLMWIRETGVIPAALVGMILSMKLPNAEIISAVTFMAIIVTLTIQASTAGYLAKLLKLNIK